MARITPRRGLGYLNWKDERVPICESGTMERIRVVEAAAMILRHMG